jgi:hypothetical protein
MALSFSQKWENQRLLDASFQIVPVMATRAQDSFPSLEPIGKRRN